MTEIVAKKKKKYPKNPVRYLARMVHELTGGGTALVEFMDDVFKGNVEGASVRDRLEAAKYLTERGYGKAPLTVEVSGNITHSIEAKYDLGKLSDAELAQVAGSLEKAQRQLPSPGQPLDAVEAAVLDVEPVPDDE